MTEAEYLTSNDPQAMLRWLGTMPCEGTDGEGRRYVVTVSDRKLRLFACGCARLVWDKLAHDRSRAAVAVAERFADGLATGHELMAASVVVQNVGDQDWATFPPVSIGGVRATVNSFESCWSTPHRAAQLPSPSAQAYLLRDIAGNPWRPVTLNPAWLTPTVVSLAQAAYDERVVPCGRCGGSGTLLDIEDFDTDARTEESCDRCHGTGIIDDGTLDPVRLAILADALEEAGCGGDVVAHLRRPANCNACDSTGIGMDEYSGTVEVPGHCPRCGGQVGPHYRGCWAVDLVLGKE